MITVNSALLLALAWVLHGWSGFQPAATVTDETVDGRIVKHIANVAGPNGGCILTDPRTPCRAGDVVHVVLEAKGSGKVSVTVGRYAKKNGGYNQTCPARKFELTPEWTRHAFDFRIGDGTAGETGACDLELVVEKGGEAFFAGVAMEIERRAADDFDEPGRHAGDAEVIQGDIAPGLLEKTGLGLIRTSSPRTIELPVTSFRLPTDGGNAFLESAVRLYSFGRTGRRKATLDVKFSGADGAESALRIVHDPAKDDLACTLVDKVGGRVVPCGRLAVPYKVLPADFILSAGVTGEIRLEVNSLADSSHRVSKGTSAFFRGRTDEIVSRMVYTPRDGAGELVIDNYSVGRADPEVRFSAVPYVLDKLPTFDPVASGWPLVFADEFNGATIDETKWERVTSAEKRPDLAFIKDGFLHVLCDWDEKHEKLQTAGVWTRERWEYGYFEAKLRFTRNSGWWAAFWLCTHSDSNAFKDGFEIDIFEDYYTRCEKPDGVHKPLLDHNLHLYGSGVLKSWNYGSELPGSLDDFYVLGCKWTPFEISYYLNGKLIASSAVHSEHKSVTFDAISHSAGFAPLSVIFSGGIMDSSWRCHDTTGFTFPEEYLIDYVRVYAYPEGPKPSVSLSCRQGFFAKPGERHRFEVTAKPAADGARVKAVYLFDSGYLIDFRTEPPYSFDVEFTDEFYARTRYMKPGRSGKTVPLANTGLHVFAAYALDEKGRYVHSGTVEKIISDYRRSRPFRGVPQKIPGTVKCGCFDEGGPNVAYCDSTAENLYAKSGFRPDEGVDTSNEAGVGSVRSGEWLTYTVDIAKAGDYRAVFTYGTPEKGRAKLHVFLDGEKVGTFDCPGHDAPHWYTDTKSVIERMRLPAGTHRMTILCEERYNFSTLEFTPCKEGSATK